MAKAISVSFDAKTGGVTKKFRAVGDTISRTKKQFRSLVTTTGQSARSMNKASVSGAGFGKSVGGIASALGPLVGGAGLLAAMKSGFDALNASVEEGATKLKALEPVLVNLQDIAQGGKDLKGLKSRARGLALIGLRGGEAVAADLLKTQRTLGEGTISDADVRLAAELSANAITEDPNALLKQFAGFKGVFGDQVGDFETFTSKLFKAGRGKLGAEQTAAFALPAAQSAKSIGASPDELLAAFAEIFPFVGKGRGRQAGSGIRRVVDALQTEGITDLGLIGGLEALRDTKSGKFAELQKTAEFRDVAQALLERKAGVQSRQAGLASDQRAELDRRRLTAQGDVDVQALRGAARQEAGLVIQQRKRGAEGIRLGLAKKQLTEDQARVLEDAPNLLKPLIAALSGLANLGLGITDLVTTIEQQALIRRDVGSFLKSGGEPIVSNRGTVGLEREHLAEMRRQTQLMEQSATEQKRTNECLSRLEKSNKATETNTRNAGGTGMFTDQKRLDLSREGEIRGTGGRIE